MSKAGAITLALIALPVCAADSGKAVQIDSLRKEMAATQTRLMQLENRSTRLENAITEQSFEICELRAKLQQH